MRRLFFSVLYLVVFSTSSFGQTDLGSTPLSHQSIALASYARLPLDFEVNSGQTDARVKFLSHGKGFSLFLADAEAVVVLKEADHGRTKSTPSLSGSTIRMQLLGANTTARVVGSEELPGKANYFIGNDPSKWRTNVPTYAKVKYEDVYPGIDLVYYGNQGRLEYDFVVAPGTEPSSIGVRFQGPDKLKIAINGDLLLLAQGVRFQKPLIYQVSAGVRKEIEGRYELVAENTVHFDIGDYDRSKPLVIDPALVYSTYLGGSGGDFGTGIAVDASLNAYVTGFTGSTDFPTANALQPMFPGVRNTVFVTKINSSGSALLYSTYLGGKLSVGGSGVGDFGAGIAVDASGNVYVTGTANTSDFPTANALQATSPVCPPPTPPDSCSPNAGSGFVTKINASGSALVYSTYLGGTANDFCKGIAVDRDGNAYVTGGAQSGDFPTVNALQSTLGSGAITNGFVSKINASGSAFVYSTYLGGGGINGPDDTGFGIAADASGNAYVTGLTRSANFPTANAFQPTLHGSQNVFVTKIDATGSAFIYSTYLGGNNRQANSNPPAITADSLGNAYVAGETSAPDFPAVNAVQPTLAGSSNAFLTKFNPSGSALVYSTFLGGSPFNNASGVAVDAMGNAYISGTTQSGIFPILNAPQPAFGGGFDGFVAEIGATGSSLVYSTYLGGSDFDIANGIAVDPLGNVYVTGATSSTNFPRVNAMQPHHLGFQNAFVTKIGSTIAERLNLSGDETSIGHICMVDGHVATCGAHFVGWSGGAGHIANGWVASPGDGKAVWEANVAYEGDVAFGKTVELVKGSTLQILLKPSKLLSESVTEGTVTWPASVHDDLGCGGGVAKVHALFTTSKDEPGSFVGCLHDLPAGSVVPPKIWGTFFTLKDSTDGHN
jgi:Beta-propeller repeat